MNETNEALARLLPQTSVERKNRYLDVDPGNAVEGSQSGKMLGGGMEVE